MKHKHIITLCTVGLMLFGVTTLQAQDTAAYHSEDVTFTNGDITLAGTLTLPATSGPHPAVIVISGSGEQDRNGKVEGFIAGYEPSRFLAEGLTPVGVAVLRFDERGIGESTGDHPSSSTADFAGDVLAAFDYLTTRDDIDDEQIGLIGHSEGSNIVAYAAARHEQVAFAISLAGQGVSGYDVLVEQTVAGATARGATQAEIDEALAIGIMEWDMVLAEDWAGLEAYTRELIATYPKILQPDEATLDEMIEQQEVFAQNWFRFFLSYNPTEDWQRIEKPVLVIFAELDTQITVAQNLEPFTEALENGVTTDYTVITLENTNHLFQLNVETGAPTEYKSLEPSFTPELMSLIQSWLLEHVTVA